MSRLLVAAALALGAATLGCSNKSVTLEPDSKFQVSVFNNSMIPLTNVTVTTGEGAAFNIPRLEHGDLSRAYNVESLHENPAVTLTADGQTLSAIPIEGFVPGFNPPLDPGAYLLTITVSDPPRALTVTLTEAAVALMGQP
jgi:hypothetical protein